MSKKYTHLYNDIGKFIEKIEEESSKPLYTLTPDEARTFLKELQLKTYNELEAEISDFEIATESAGSVSVRFIRPKNSESEKLPLIFYLHGGGWVMGDEFTHDELVRKLAVNTNSCVVFVKYSLSPEAYFPEPFNQVYAVFNYLYENSEKFNFLQDKIILAGDSAGANMTAALTLRLKDEKQICPLFQVLLYPALDFRMQTNSYKEFENGPWLTKKAMEWFWNSYIQDRIYFENYYAVPSIADIKDLKGLPPALIITAENDVLRDEGEEYALKLDGAGVPVQCVRILGVCHDFLMLNALSNTNPVRTAFSIVYDSIKHYLKSG